MGEALIRGLLRSKLLPPSSLIVSDKNRERLAFLHRKYKIETTSDNKHLIRHAQNILLAVKPQNRPELFPEISPWLSKKHLVISIMAGVDIPTLKGGLKGFKALVRVMPNLPALIDSGIAGIYCTRSVSKKQKRFAHQIFEAVGKTVDIPKEKWMDAVTGLSGTGPAYLFALIEALMKGGKTAGLPSSVAKQLTLETMVGAAQMALQTNLPPEELRKRVTSKKGTTWAAMKIFKKKKFWNTVEQAVVAATKRSHQLRGK